MPCGPPPGSGRQVRASLLCSSACAHPTGTRPLSCSTQTLPAAPLGPVPSGGTGALASSSPHSPTRRPPTASDSGPPRPGRSCCPLGPRVLPRGSRCGGTRLADPQMGSFSPLRREGGDAASWALGSASLPSPTPSSQISSFSAVFCPLGSAGPCGQHQGRGRGFMVTCGMWPLWVLVTLGHEDRN